MRKIIFSLLLCCMLLQIVFAESGTFEYYAGMTEEFNTATDPFYTPYNLLGLKFNQIEYYTELQSITLRYLDTGQYLLNHSANSITVPFDANNETTNTTIGSGNIGYAKVSGGKLVIYVYFDSWNIEDAGTGSQCLRLFYNYTQLGLRVNRWDTTGDYFTNPEDLGITYYLGGCGRACAMEDVDDKYTVIHAYNFTHYWDTNAINSYTAFINVTKKINGIPHNSSVNISSPYTTYYDNIESSNISVLVVTTFPPIHLKVIDDINNIYHAYIFSGGNQTLTGKVIDRSNNHIINNVSISWYANNNLYDIHTYNSPFTQVLPTIVDKAQFIKSGYTQENYSIDLTTQTNYVFRLTQIGVYEDDTSTIYGNVFDYANNNTINNAHITIDNYTWSDDTYSNSYGYYEFTNLSIDLYNITTYAFEYHTDDTIFNVSSTNTAYMNDIYLSRVDALSTPSPKPTNSLGLPIYEEEDIWTWIFNNIVWVALLVLLLFLYVLYDRSNIRKLWSNKRR